MELDGSNLFHQPSTSEVRPRCWLIKPESFILQVKDGVGIRALHRPDNFSEEKKKRINNEKVTAFLTLLCAQGDLWKA